MFVDIDKLAAMYRDAGLTVDVLAGAHRRAARLFASSGYTSAGPRGSDIHHTAQGTGWMDQQSINYLAGFTHPNSYVMANVYPHKDTVGRVTIIAAGPTYTAGKGGPIGDIPLDRGNNHGWSMECPNNGVGERWPVHLQETMVTLSAGHAEFFGWPVDRGHFFAHFEYAPTRKIDPYGPSKYTDYRNEKWGMGRFRYDVELRHAELYSTPPPPKEVEDMQVRFTTTNRLGQFLVGAGMPVHLSAAMVAEQFHLVPLVIGHGPEEDERWDEYKAIWEAAQS